VVVDLLCNFGNSNVAIERTAGKSIYNINITTELKQGRFYYGTV